MCKKGTQMRKNYIDNLRWIFILFLFPYHTFMVFNSFGESFYVKGADIKETTYIITAAWTWLMPTLFLLAGISSAYAIKKRTAAEFMKERVLRLLIPLIFGVLLLVPVQTYFAELFHNGYTGNYFEQYILFFTKPTDLTGYNGGFSPAHLWFILYLFLISVISLPIMYAYQKSKKKLPAEKIPLPVLMLFFIIPIFSQMILDFGGKSLGEYLSWFLFGFFFLSNDATQEKLEKYRFPLLGIAVPCMIIYTAFGDSIYNYSAIIYELLYSFYALCAVLAVFGLGKKYLNFKNNFSIYLSNASFPIYIIHQQWIVVTAYFTLKTVNGVPLQMVCIMLSSVVLTFLTYEVLKRFSPTRFILGMK